MLKSIASAVTDKSSSGIIVDFGLGNLAALRRKVAELDPAVRIATSADDLAASSYLILPGVGHFARAMDNLARGGLLPALNRMVLEKKTPILGICVGMQLFARYSEEGNVPGLGWIDAEILRIPSNGLRVPHIGWNCLSVRRYDEILRDVEPDQRFYFIHSFHMVCRDPDNVLAATWYGRDLTAVVRKEHIIGTQFHPEKSHRRGMRVVANFLKMAGGGK